jgi:hypothetical protein
MSMKMNERTNKFERELRDLKQDLEREHRDAVDDHKKMQTLAAEQLAKFKTTLTHLDDECR